jgi:hypothetical protein
MRRAYIDTILSSKPVNRVCPRDTIMGSNVRFRSRGVSSAISPKSPFSALVVMPLRELPLLLPAWRVPDLGSEWPNTPTRRVPVPQERTTSTLERQLRRQTFARSERHCSQKLAGGISRSLFLLLTTIQNPWVEASERPRQRPPSDAHIDTAPPGAL